LYIIYIIIDRKDGEFMKRLVSLLLITALLLGLAGCHTQPPVETSPNATVTDPTGSSPTLTPTDPTDPMDPIMQCYREAIASLSGLVDTTVEVNFTEKLTVSGDTYTNRSKQTITYLGLGTEDFRHLFTTPLSTLTTQVTLPKPM
jgi:predicted small lipoprotein YifL